MIAGSFGQQGLRSSCDEFSEQIRLCADVPFLVLAYFDPALRKFTCFSCSKDAGFSADRCEEMTVGAQRRLAVFSTAAQPESARRDLATQTPSAPGFPVWLEEADCLLGVGQPIVGTYPVVGIPKPAEYGKTIDPKLLRLCFTYLSQSLVRSLYSNPTWPHALVETTLKVLSIEFFMVTADGEIVVDGRTRDNADTGGWQVVKNHLTVPDDRERAALRDAIRSAATAPGKASIVSITMEPGTVRLSAVAPVQSLDEGLAVVLFERRNTDHFALREHFFRAYGLTKSESLIAHEVLDGKSMAEAAAITRFALETARSYMKAILVKTGTHRQQELISLYYSSILPIGRTIAAAENRRLNPGQAPLDKSRTAVRGN